MNTVMNCVLWREEPGSEEAVLTKMCKMQMKRIRETTVRARATQRKHVLESRTC